MDISLSQPSSKCQICSQQAHGHHFGALTCRACAAFFRRCHFSPVSDPKCRLLTGECEPENGRWKCKKCRWERCLSLGMTPENIQYDRDSFKSSVNFLRDRTNLPMTIESTLGVSHLVTFIKRDVPENCEMVYLDMSRLAHIINDQYGSLSKSISKTAGVSNLEQLSRGLTAFRASQEEHLVEIPLISAADQMSGMEKNIYDAANWLNCSEAVRELEPQVRLQLIQCIWSVWNMLERIAMTARMRVNRRCGERQFVFCNKFLVDFDRMSSDISWWTHYAFEELAFFFNPSEVFYDPVVWEVMEVQPDDTELTFLLCTLCFHLTGKVHQGGEVERETDRLQELLADDLHNYYTQQKQTTRYSTRLKRLMRINERFLRLWHQRGEKYTVGSSLNMFQMRLSNPEFFRLSC